MQGPDEYLIFNAYNFDLLMRQMVTAMCLLESLVLNCGDSLLSHEWQCGSPARSYFGRLRGLLWNRLGLVAPSREQVWVLQIYLTVISLVPHAPWAQNLPSRPYGKSLPVSQGRWRKIHFLFQEPNRKGRDDLKRDWNGDVGSIQLGSLYPSLSFNLVYLYLFQETTLIANISKQ